MLPPNPLSSLCPLPRCLVIPLLVLSGCPRGSLCHRVLSVIHTLISKAFQPAHSCPGGSSKGAAKARQETWWRAERQASPVFRLVSMRLAARRTFCASSPGTTDYYVRLSRCNRKAQCFGKSLLGKKNVQHFSVLWLCSRNAPRGGE